MANYIKLALLIAAGFLVPATAFAADVLPPIDSPAYTQAQNMVQVEPGRRLNLYCTGEGDTTVIFEAGSGWPMVVWGYVQPAIAKNTRACSYDRAGIGFSDGTKRPSTSANIVDDLHHLLAAANIKPPYVLVGHSLGGMTVRLYADKYPSEVVALVLVDPAVEDQNESFRKINPKHPTAAQWHAEMTEPNLKSERECVAAAEHGIAPGSDMFNKCTSDKLPQLSDAIEMALHMNEIKLPNQLASLSEDENAYYASADQVRASRHSYGDMPLIVLTRGQPSATKPDATPADLAYHDAIVQLWRKLHDDVAALSTRGSNEIVPGARHFIQFDKPQAVIDAINRAIRLAGEKTTGS